MLVGSTDYNRILDLYRQLLYPSGRKSKFIVSYTLQVRSEVCKEFTPVTPAPIPAHFNKRVLDFEFDNKGSLLLECGYLPWGLKLYDVKDLCSSEVDTFKPPSLLAQKLTKSKVDQVQWYHYDSGMFLVGATGRLENEGALSIWDTRRFQRVVGFVKTTAITTFQMCPTSTTHYTVAVGLANKLLGLVDLRTSNSQMALKGLLLSVGLAFDSLIIGHKHHIRSLAWSRTNEHLMAAGDSGGNILLWDIRHNAAPVPFADVRGLPPHSRRDSIRTRVPAHQAAIVSLCSTISPNFLVSLSADSQVKIWSLNSLEKISAFYCDADCTFSTIKKYVVAATGSRSSNCIANNVVLLPGYKRPLAYRLQNGQPIELFDNTHVSYNSPRTCTRIVRLHPRIPMIVASDESKYLGVWVPKVFCRKVLKNRDYLHLYRDTWSSSSD